MLRKFIVASAATWRLSSLLVREDGPFNVFRDVRSAAVASRNQTAIGIVSCVWCASVWFGLLSTLLALSKLEALLWPFAASGVAIMMDKYVQHKPISDGARSGPD